MEKQQFIDQSFHKQVLEIRPGYPEMCKTPAGAQRVDISKTANTFYSGLHDLVQFPEIYSQTLPFVTLCPTIPMLLIKNCQVLEYKRRKVVVYITATKSLATHPLTALPFLGE